MVRNGKILKSQNDETVRIMTDKEFVLSIYPNAYLDIDKRPYWYGFTRLWADSSQSKLLAYWREEDLIWFCAKIAIDKEILTRLED